VPEGEPELDDSGTGADEAEGGNESMRANVSKAAKNIDAMAEQLRAVADEMSALEGEIGGLRDSIAPRRAKLKEDLVHIELQVKESLRQSYMIADVQNVIGRFGAQLEAVVKANGGQVLAASEMRRSNE
jgi:archaellum component FlaC